MEQKAAWALTLLTVILTSACIAYAARLSSTAFLLLAFVCFGTGFDFFSHVLGALFPHKKNFLLWYARINFSALCFGIVFTPMAATFVIARLYPSGLNSVLAALFPALLLLSLLFGALFMLAKYRAVEESGSLEYTLDKTNPYTYRIFFARRILLALSLVIALLAVYEAFHTDRLLWALHFAAFFIATIPLHILHKKIASMVMEAVTLLILFYGTMQVFIER